MDPYYLTICYKSTVGSKPEPDAPDPEKSSGNSTPFSFESEKMSQFSGIPPARDFLKVSPKTYESL